jgi:hypothetical protein
MANNHPTSDQPGGFQSNLPGHLRPPYHVGNQPPYSTPFGHPSAPQSMQLADPSAGATLSVPPSQLQATSYNGEFALRSTLDGMPSGHGLGTRYAYGQEGGVGETQRQGPAGAALQDHTISVQSSRPMTMGMQPNGYARMEAFLGNPQMSAPDSKTAPVDAAMAMRMSMQMAMQTPGATPTLGLMQEQMLQSGQGGLAQLNATAELLAAKGDFTNAINFYERITALDPENGVAWTALGHCYLLTDELQKAFGAYQKALYSLPDVRDPQLWYGIGLLYDKVSRLVSAGSSKPTSTPSPR